MVIRGVVCIIWMGVQSSVGGNAVRCMIEAIWPSFKHWHTDALPASAAITAPDLLCFALFWLAQLPLMFFSINTLRWMFILKIIIMPFFGVALFTWALTAANGWGPLFTIPNKITDGWTVGYVFCTTITAAISSNATFAINQGDITRYAHDRKAVPTIPTEAYRSSNLRDRHQGLADPTSSACLYNARRAARDCNGGL